MVIAFVIWSMIGVLFIALGIFSLFSKKAIGFWANAEMFQVTDVGKYNRAICKLFCIFGIIFIMLGIPLLYKEKPALIIVSILGTMLLSIISMAVYATVIENKYKK